MELAGTIATTGFSEDERNRGLLVFRMFCMDSALLAVNTGRGEEEMGREDGGIDVVVVEFFSFSSSVLLSIDTSPASENGELLVCLCKGAHDLTTRLRYI